MFTMKNGTHSATHNTIASTTAVEISMAQFLQVSKPLSASSGPVRQPITPFAPRATSCQASVGLLMFQREPAIKSIEQMCEGEAIRASPRSSRRSVACLAMDTLDRQAHCWHCCH
jgi:hypothetical protein